MFKCLVERVSELSQFNVPTTSYGDGTSSERPEKQGVDNAATGLVVQRGIHYITADPVLKDC